MGLYLRITDTYDPNPFINVLGSTLSWPQGDNNWLYLLHNVSSSNGDPVFITANTITITGNPTITGNTTINGNLTLTGTLNATASWAYNALTSSNIEGGTTNYIPLWKTNTSLSSSIIYQSSGKIGIGIISPNYNLTVSGTVAFPNLDESVSATNIVLLGTNGQLFYTASSALAGTIAGDFVNKTTFNAFTSSINNFTSSITASVNRLITSASNALYTASVSSNIITFTKGNGTTFAITVNTGSGGVSGDYVTTSSFNVYTSSINTFTGSAITGAAIVGGNNVSNVIRFTRKDTTTFDITVNTGSGTGTVGPGVQNYLAYFSGSTTTISSSNVYYDRANTRIGINVGTTPLYTLDVDGTGSFRRGIISTGSVYLKNIGAQNQNNILVYDSSTGQVTYTSSTAAGVDTNIYNANGTLSGNRTVTFGGNYLDFAGTATTRFFSNGNIGIGVTTDVGNKLDISGSTRISGSFTVTGSTVYLKGLTSQSQPHLLSYNSSSGQLYYITTSSFLTSVPTLQQVTTAGSSSTDDIYVDGVFIKPTGISNWVAALDHTTVGGNSVGAIKLRENSDGSGQIITITAPTLTTDSVLTIPDNTNRVFALSVNGNYANAVGDISLPVGSTSGVITTGSAGQTQAITGSLIISGSPTTGLTVSGAMFVSLSQASYTDVVVYDTSTRRLYYTSSVGGGGGIGPISVTGSTLYSNDPVSTTPDPSTAINSIFLGSNAGNGATSANNSNFFGAGAGSDAINADHSNFFGEGAGFEATNAQYSNFLGFQAGSEATNAYSSNFLGESAGFQATDANNSNFFGPNAGFDAENAYYSNFLGYQAGFEATNAFDSNFLGNSAGNGATNAANSNFLGENAGYQATDANNSNFFGAGAGSEATDANNSNFLGYQAGSEATNAYSSNFFGPNAGSNATNANYSNFLGNGAGNGASLATRSNFIGTFAGNQAVSASYSNFIGDEAGYSASKASYSTFIGYRAGFGSGSGGVSSVGSNNIIIGTNITLANDRKDSINIGGIIFGTGSYNTISGNPFTGSTNGRVGINVVSPTATLHISSSINSGDLLKITTGSNQDGLTFSTSNSGGYLKVGNFSVNASNTGSANIFSQKEIMTNGGFNTNNPDSGYAKTGLYPGTGNQISFWAGNQELSKLTLVGSNVNGSVLDIATGHNPATGTGTVNIIRLAPSILPTGGPVNIDYNQILIAPGIQQTTFGSGSLRGIYYAPGVSSLGASRHIAIETTSGDVIFGGDIVSLPFKDPLPSSKPTGSIALSGSGGTFEGMYVYNGTSWTKVGP